MNMITKCITAATLSAAALGTAAHAGNVEAAPAPAPVEPLTFAQTTDWTGFYGGLQFGTADAGGDAGLDGNAKTYGLHAGYDFDLGDYVLGAEIDYDKTDIDLNGGAANIDDVARLKFKGGYDLGSTLIYATAGAASADTSVGTETGAFYGLGVTFKVTERYTIGAEVLDHRFSDVGGTAGADLDVTTFNIRGGIRF